MMCISINQKRKMKKFINIGKYSLLIFLSKMIVKLKMNNESIIQLQTSSVLNIPLQTYEENFIFIVNNEEFRTSRLISQLLSPKISLHHKNDPTLDKYIINTKSHGDFTKIIDLVNFQSKSISDNELPFFIEILEQLGTDSIKISNFNQTDKLTNDNIFKKIKMTEKIAFKINDELIEYISSHFFELCSNHESELKNLDLDTLVRIVNHPKLTLINEDQLVNFINSMYSKEREYSILYEAVLFSNLVNFTISEFVNIFDINDINSQIWRNISQRLEKEIKSDEKDEKTRYKGYKINGQIFSPEDDDIFNGIIQYLQTKCNWDAKINVTSSSVNGNYFPSNVTKYEDRNKWFHSQSQPNNWICFDFKEKKVMPTSYKIRSSLYSANSYNPKSWNIEGSNDNANWDILSEEKDSPLLNGKHIVHLFSITQSNNKSYRYIRMKLTGPDWCYFNYFMLDSFEIYGQLI